jgi:photosystem II stability/assembly factor-like uncharacterized protein
MRRITYLFGPATALLLFWSGCGSENNNNNNNPLDGGGGSSSGNTDSGGGNDSGGGDAGGEAGAPTWSASGLNQANIIPTLVIDRKDPKNVFAGISAGSTETGLWRSKDAGKTWAKVGGGLPAQYFGLVTISPATNTIFANPGVEGIWHSTNGGDNWTLSTSSLTDPGNTSGMLCHPTIDMTWLVTSQQGLYRSNNGGVSFTHPTNTNLPLNQFGLGPLAFDGAKLYLGTSGHGIYISTDNGDSWTQATSTNIPTMGATGEVINLAATGSRPGVLFVKTNGGGLFKSTDSAATFTVLNPGKTARYAGLRLDPDHTSTLFISMGETSGDPGGLYQSIDDGQTWKPLGKDFQAVNVIDVAPNGTILVGTVGEGVWRRE